MQRPRKPPVFVMDTNRFFPQYVLPWNNFFTGVRPR